MEGNGNQLYMCHTKPKALLKPKGMLQVFARVVETVLRVSSEFGVQVLGVPNMQAAVHLSAPETSNHKSTNWQ